MNGIGCGKSAALRLENASSLSNVLGKYWDVLWFAKPSSKPICAIEKQGLGAEVLLVTRYLN